ncbi:HET-domain-containing protein [Ophiobolus disseminans]|uniref:HET-domain-containing protein n=1 Tax=Ophiobolus disseminans TaxID=1469910 RepID=A0A6A6ZW81_9PLEO|nr:HET-domain-containing protein [Ophiobolus disseminans]
MLCAMCVSIFQTRGSDVSDVVRGKHHGSIEDVETAAEQGCYLCSELILDYEYEEGENPSGTVLSFELELARMIVSPRGRLGLLSFESADGRLSSATYEIVYTANLQTPQGYHLYLEQVKSDLDKQPWRVRCDGFPASTDPVSESTGDLSVLKTARDWLDCCLVTHASCGRTTAASDPQWYPKRLLDLSSEVRQHIVLTEQEIIHEPYATLSHCWGPNPSICCLTAENMDGYRQDIPNDVLTNSFRDAIAAARMLKIRYIWIDSLCILQSGMGSQEDWQEHAVAMRRVYSNALVNIAAARAESGADGLFASRPDALLRPCHVQWGWPIKRRDGVDKRFWTIRKSGRHESHSIRTLPLYTRGWVVQERFLAPRVLHFASDRIFWECAELSLVEESFPHGFQDSCPEYKTIVQWPFSTTEITLEASAVRNDSDLQASSSDPTWALWQGMLNEYTRCDLSFPDKDMFVAISGIAERFGSSFNHEYVAGFFRQHLPFDLLWQNKGERSETYRAPSWSWASIDGGVQFAVEDCPYCDVCCNRLATVKDAFVELVNVDNIYGAVKGAELVMTGYLLPCEIQAVATTGTGLRQKVAIFPHLAHDKLFDHAPQPDDPLRQSTSTIFGEADIDDEEDSLRGFAVVGQFTAWAIPIIELKIAPDNSYAKHWGLLVKKKSCGKYERLGIYRVKEWVMAKMLEEKACIEQDVCLV